MELNKIILIWLLKNKYRYVRNIHRQNKYLLTEPYLYFLLVWLFQLGIVENPFGLSVFVENNSYRVCSFLY